MKTSIHDRTGPFVEPALRPRADEKWNRNIQFNQDPSPHVSLREESREFA